MTAGQFEPALVVPNYTPRSEAEHRANLVAIERAINGIVITVGGLGGAAGGVLGGTYPNPSFAVDMATQAELDAFAATAATDAELNAHITDTTDAHDASAVSFVAGGSIAATDVQTAVAEVATDYIAADTALIATALLKANNLSDVASASTSRTNLGLGSGDTPTFTGVNIGNTDATITRSGSGDIQIEGNILYRLGGTDVSVADGGTGASNAANARTNLGLVIGTDVQAWDADLDSLAAVGITAAGLALLDDANVAAQRTTLGLGTTAVTAPDASTIEISGSTLRVKADGITANEIAAGAVGASELASTAATPGTYGSAAYTPVITVDADGRIIASSHVVSVPAAVGVQAAMTEGANLLSNGNFDTNATGWTGSNCSVARDTGTKRTGAGSLKLTASSAADMYAYTPEGTSGIAITEGAAYVFLWFSLTAVTPRVSTATIRWYNSAGTFLSAEVNTGAYNLSNTWAGITTSGVAPAAAAYASVRVNITAPANTEVHYADDAVFFRSSSVVAAYSSASTGPRLVVEPDIAGVNYYTGVDGESLGRIYADTALFSSIPDRAFMSMAPPKLGGVTGAQIVLWAASVANPTTAPPQITLTADTHAFAETTPDSMRLVANVGGDGDKPLCPLLAYKEYASGSDTTFSSTSTSYVDIDATNLVVSFTAPKSGKVVVELVALSQSAAATSQYWALRSGSSDVAATPQIVNNSTSPFRPMYRKIMTGLTAGTVYTWKWAWKTGSGTTLIYHGPTYGYCSMLIWGIME